MNILITGASKGIGYEVCSNLLEDSSNKVIAISRSSENLKNKEIFRNGRFTHLSLDLGVTGFTAKVIPAIGGFFPKIDIIINNAGLLINKPIADLSDKDFDNMFNVNVKSVFSLVRDMLPHLNPGAHIVNITSMGGFQGSSKFLGLSLYSSSKGALSILTEAMAEELKDKQISVNALALGAVQTEMLSNAFPGYKAPVTASEMAGFISNFALTGHKYFNGKILPVSLSTP